MDDGLIIIVFSLCLALIVYFILDLQTEEEEVIEDRLDRISKMDDPELVRKKKVSLIDNIITFYIEPVMHQMKKKKSESGKDLSSNDARKILMQAGKPFSDDDVFRFKAVQILSMIVTAVICLVVAGMFLRNNLMIAFAFVGVATMVGFRFPVLQLRLLTKKRYQEIQYNLPDTLDLLVVCVEAGLGLDAAMTRVAQEQMRTAPVLAREVGRVSKDIMAGVQRSEAFRNLAMRNDVPDLKSLVALLVQTDKLGTSISQSLRIYADTVRTKRRQKAEKLASEASVKMVIPLVLFILPSMFVVLLGPAILNLVQQFGGSI
ncbi:MAG: type II secretion system F family protein [Cyanobacteriota bacterium]